MSTISPSDYTHTFAEVYLTELDYLKNRRQNMNLPTETLQTESKRVHQEINKLTEKISSDNVAPKEKPPRLDVRMSTEANLVGLAFSGGGIRSATFNLGLLQTFDKNGILRYCDYLSTVSGGGYIGSCLSSLLTNPKATTDSNAPKEQGNFPFRFHRDSESDEYQEVNYDLPSATNSYEECREVNYLRAAKNYLEIGRGLLSLDTWRVMAMLLSGLILVNIIPLILSLLMAYGLFELEKPIATYTCQEVQTGELTYCSYNLLKNDKYKKIEFDREQTKIKLESRVNSLFQIALYAFIVMVMIRGLVAFFNLNHQIITGLQALLLITTAVLIVGAGLITFTYYLFADQEGAIGRQLLSWLNYTLLASLLFFLLGRLNTANRTLQKLLNLMWQLALITLIPIIFAHFLRLLWEYDVLRKPVSEFLSIWIQTSLFDGIPIPIFLALILFIASLMVNINRISLHAFYRSGLSKTYLIKKGEDGKIHSNRNLKLKDIHEHYNGPYHLINATINLQGSKNRHLKGRGADYFLFSKFYCGAESTGYRSTETYNRGETELATAMAISGAAASPAMGTHTNGLMAFYMILFNIRLNYWMPNPDPKRTLGRFTLWPWYFLKEFLRFNRENDLLLNLSDGGHHENLGVYSLLKRRCRIIIVSDAASDPDYQMEDLANLQRKARIDLGINIDIDMTPLRPNQIGNTNRHFVKGTIYYPNDKNGTLFYIKTSMTGREPEDLLAYRRKNPRFPDETTANQFFNEDQFESYRKLGEVAGKEASSEIEIEINTILFGK